MNTIALTDDRPGLIFRVALAEAAHVTGVAPDEILRGTTDRAREIVVAVNLASEIYDGPATPVAREALATARVTFDKRIVEDADRIVERLKLKLAPAPEAGATA